MCAATAGQRGRRVLVLEHSNNVRQKILMSGGGRCNFTTSEVEPRHYRSENSHFCISALRRYPPERFLQLVHKHQVPYHEKTLGQLFCDRKSKNILDLLLAECEQGQVQIRTSRPVRLVTRWPGFQTQAPGSSLEADPVPRSQLTLGSGPGRCHCLVVHAGG